MGMSEYKAVRGQFFTVNKKVHEIMTDLLNPFSDATAWDILEPSAGSGWLMKVTEDYCAAHGIENYTLKGWELDTSIKPIDPSLNIVYQEFFEAANTAVAAQERYQTIIGNPPYVGWKNVEDYVKTQAMSVQSRYTINCNLYYLFIDRCIDLLREDGEMVLIVPKEWFYTTSAAPLREKIYREGKITHIIDGGEEKVFPDADIPAVVIFRFQKTIETGDDYSFQFKTGFLDYDANEPWETKTLVEKEGGWLFVHPALEEILTHSTKTVKDYFDVKVGLVSGADPIYRIAEKDLQETFAAEGTLFPFVTTKGVEHFLFVDHCDTFEDIPPATANYLLQHKERLIGRKIAKFTEANWWKYGAVRNYQTMSNPETPRIYTFSKTRREEPFFTVSTDDATLFTGAILGLFARDPDLLRDDASVQAVVRFFNSPDFRSICESMGLTTSNKVSFQPKTLERVPVPTLT